MYPFIHHLNSREPIPADIGREVGCTLYRSPVYCVADIQRQIHTHSYVNESPGDPNPNLHVFGQWEEAGVPCKCPCESWTGIRINNCLAVTALPLVSYHKNMLHVKAWKSPPIRGEAALFLLAFSLLSTLSPALSQANTDKLAHARK